MMEAPAPEAPPAPAGPSEADRLAGEIASQLASGMVNEAALSLEMLRAQAPDDPRLGSLQAKVEQATLRATASTPVKEFDTGTIAAAAEHAARPPVETTVSPGDWPAPAPPVASHQAPPAPAAHHEEEFSLDLDVEAPAHHEESFELSLDLDEPPAQPTPAPPKAAPPPPSRPAPPPTAAPMGINDLLGSLDQDLAGLEPPAASKHAPQPAAKAPKAEPKAPPKAAPPGGLADMFAEFKEEMEQDAGVESDIENHYNMGVAFKEMGLYDEAIGEFQKAFHGAESLPNNPQFIPVCSLLAHCFLEKNLPELAVKWLQNGLKAPGLDQEGEMALRYEIGSAQEASGQKAAALESFMQVYALNIDYRDVADRIRSLKGN
jgi:hypothetical protein